MGQQLHWGRHYLMVEPDHFRVDYAINPFMDLADQPDPARAREQWLGLVEALRGAGAERISSHRRFMITARSRACSTARACFPTAPLERRWRSWCSRIGRLNHVNRSRRDDERRGDAEETERTISRMPLTSSSSLSR